MKRGKVFASSLIVGASAAAVGWLVWGSPWLRAQSVSITVAQVSETQWRDSTLTSRVREVLPNLRNRPLASVDTAAITESVRKVRGVLDVDVRRGWPHTIAVLVRPRIPVAVFSVKRADTQMWQLVDAQSVVVAERAAPPRGWVVLAVSPATPGGKAAMDVWAGLPSVLRSRVTQMSARNPMSAASVEFTLRGGARVVWGDVQSSPRKAQVLDALLKYPARVYDVSAPDVPTTTK